MMYKNKNIVVACPSYKRYKVETLNYIPFCKVYVSPQEYDAYLEFNAKQKENIIKCPEGIQGNLCRVRNYILDTEFNNGADIVLLIDDDLRAIEHFEMSEDESYAYEKVKLKTNEIIEFIYRYSMLCYEWGFKFWGINCNSDTKAYSHCSPFSTVSYIGGPFQCFLKGNKLRYDESLPLKEDYDMTLQNMNMYRGALRINKYHYVCRQSEQSGGCAMYRNMEREKEQFELLRKKWGSKIVRLDTGRKEGKRGNKKKRVYIDYNPIIKVPINGI